MNFQPQTSNLKSTLVVITGPTAVGKTALCVKIAQYFNTEIISADSRQFYKELNIGTAKPTAAEMQNIKHHFVDFQNITSNYNVNDFEKDALKLLSKLFKKHNVILLTGGSGLYIDALCNGFDDGLPEANIEIRKQINLLYQQHGIVILQEKLKQLDPAFYKTIDLNNVNRLQRAIEVCLVTGKTYSKLRQGKKQKRPFNIVKIVLQRDRNELFSKINMRVDEMMENGLLDEVKVLSKFKNYNALKTVGYTELFNFLDGIFTLEEAIEKIKVNTRRYAKRQMAWFKKDANYTWFHPNEKDKIINFINNQ